jgi:hypothetical protein
MSKFIILEVGVLCMRLRANGLARSNDEGGLAWQITYGDFGSNYSITNELFTNNNKKQWV